MSPQFFVASSPLSHSDLGRRRRSQFTYKHLSRLSAYSTTCPLRVVAHIDLDAFYAQCEMIRLGVAEDQPLVVQQWQGLIAVNYPARKFGISRFAPIMEAKKLCPSLILQHVATWKEGQEQWAYYEDAADNIATHKVSLDPYRMQSRKIVALIKDSLPAAPHQRVEKASIDEVFVDLSAQVHSILLERYPELSRPAPYDDPTENLPRPPTTALDWGADTVIDLDETETEDDDLDWDDIAMLIGSEIVRSVRASIRKHLRYTCSAGIAQNKMLAKLGSGYKKPNQQTIVRNRAVHQFLSGFKFTKIRSLGGKLGDEVASAFSTEMVQDLLQVGLEQLKKKLGDEGGTFVHQIIRGVDYNEVNARTQIKSMLSAKSFRPSINTLGQACPWLRIFVADIFSRLVEEGVLDNKRRPKVINLHHRRGGQTKARQVAIPSGKAIDEASLFELARQLLVQIIAEGDSWPCANLSLSVAGFEDGIVGNRSIGSFLVTGQEALALRPSGPTTLPPQRTGYLDMNEQANTKRRRADEGGGIQKFFRRSSDEAAKTSDPNDLDCDGHTSVDTRGANDAAIVSGNRRDPLDPSGSDIGPRLASNAYTYLCSQCPQHISVLDREEHNDWHLAESLQRQERGPSRSSHSQHSSTTSKLSGTSLATHLRRNTPSSSSHAGVGVSGGPKSSKIEKGQSRLMFGR